MNIVKRFLLCAVCAAGAWALAGCTTNPATGRSQLDLLSREDEIALGEEAMPELVSEYGGEVGARELRDYVTEIGERMAALTEGDAPTLPWEFTVLDSDVINAFALPGGKVFVSRGLLSYMNNEAQLAAVLGHEIGHVTAQHIDERLSRAMGAQFITEIAAGAAGGEGWGAAVPYVVGAVGQGYLLSFGRSQEREADRLGLRYMTAAGYDPTGMVQLLGILVDVSEGGARSPEFLSTHPNPKSRREDALALVRSEYNYAVDGSGYGLFPDRFERHAAPHLTLRSAAAMESAPPVVMWCAHCRDVAE